MSNLSLPITVVTTPSNKYSVKCPYFMEPIGVTIHETGNIQTAMGEISYMLGNDREVSYHYAVDEVRAVQGLPLNRNGWHSGDGANGRGNRRTIGIEHCYNWTGGSTTRYNSKYNALYQKTLLNGIELTAQLFIKYPKWGVPERGKNIWRHYDHDGKNCPQRMIEEGRWVWYVEQVKKRYLELKKNPNAVYEVTSTNGIERVEQDTGSFKPNDIILVRDRPSTSGKHIASYAPPEVLEKYDRVHYGNGYVWLEYSRQGKSPAKGYLPIRTYQNGVYGDMWGNIGEVGDYVYDKSLKDDKDYPFYKFRGQGHVEGKGWIPMEKNMIGTTGQNKRLEAFNLTVEKDGKPIPVFGELHIQGIGDVVVDTNLFGTVGEKRRLEAIKLNIDDAVEYRVHMQIKGWSPWTTNKQWAGSKGKERRIEAIEFRVKK